ncbi:MAG: SseB family protein [Rothia sp. (in: high G+C Gram-positive bacteria)]|nr:SseB family protein [Rothia sp. (in: high G+C Gram-positive bacteria)]
MSLSSPRYSEIERPAMVQDALNTIGSWMLGTVKVEAGWNELVLDIKPLSETVFVRITESRDDQDHVGSVGPIKPDSPVLPAIEQLQHASFIEGEGTWFTASVVITASDWPDPQYQIGASYDRAHEPVDWNGEGRLSARDIRSHFESFPRDEQYIPEWAAVRLAGRRGTGFAETGKEGQLPVGPVNPYLTEALASFAAARSEQSLANVVRTAQAGNLIMDITQSASNTQGPAQLNYQVLRLANGMRALTAYTGSEPAQRYSAQVLKEPNPRLVVEHAMKVFLQVAHDDSIDVLVLDPGSDHECFIEKAQIQWVIGSPHNMPAQRALLEENMHDLLMALTAPASVLLLGVRPDDTVGHPVVLKTDDDEENIALVFTTAAEVAALDPSLVVRSAPALDTLKLFAAGNSGAVRINALAPHATLPMEQVRQLISVVESQ